jgi:hypothetical protein
MVVTLEELTLAIMNKSRLPKEEAHDLAYDTLNLFGYSTHIVDEFKFVAEFRDNLMEIEDMGLIGSMRTEGYDKFRYVRDGKIYFGPWRVPYWYLKEQQIKTAAAETKAIPQIVSKKDEDVYDDPDLWAKINTERQTVQDAAGN